MLLGWCGGLTRHGAGVDGVGGFGLSLGVNSGLVRTSGKVDNLSRSGLGDFGT